MLCCVWDHTYMLDDKIQIIRVKKGLGLAQIFSKTSTKAKYKASHKNKNNSKKESNSKNER